MHKPFSGEMPLLLLMIMCQVAFAPDDGSRSKANPSGDQRSSEHNVNRMIRNSFSKFNGEYIILVRKSTFTLEIVTRDNQVVAKYPIAYGRNPDKKAPLYGGDNRTPEGEYSISVILSKDADTATASYRDLAGMNRMYFSAKEGHSKFNHPEEDQGDNAIGPRDYHFNYPDSNDLKNYTNNKNNGKIPIVDGKPLPLSHRYDIHGNCDKPSIGHLATSGCIRMDNTDIVEMEKYVQIGTPVIILPANQ